MPSNPVASKSMLDELVGVTANSRKRMPRTSSKTPTQQLGHVNFRSLAMPVFHWSKVGIKERFHLQHPLPDSVTCHSMDALGGHKQCRVR